MFWQYIIFEVFLGKEEALGTYSGTGRFMVAGRNNKLCKAA